MLRVQDLSYSHPNRELLFQHLHFSLARHQKAALIGNNGTGKSTLLRLLAGGLRPSSGSIHAEAGICYVPQHFGQFDGLTVAQALGMHERIDALRAILAGDVSEARFAQLADDWTVEERLRAALTQWGLPDLDPAHPMAALSGGQKTRVFLAGTALHPVAILLLDEPGNHLDAGGRAQLEAYLRHSSATILAVSHDRALLRLFNPVLELGPGGITVYGGSYDFYREQKAIGTEALGQELRQHEKELRKARQVQREAAERKQKLDARGRRKQDKAGVPTIALNTLRNNAEKSSARLKGAHEEKVAGIAGELQALRAALPDPDAMKLGFDNARLHRGKLLFAARGINHDYGQGPLWAQNLSFEIRSGERLSLQGPNGSGKTTLLRIILGALAPATGSTTRALERVVYIDQDYSLLDPARTVFGQAECFNRTGLQEHELGIVLARFLFARADWERPCAGLSGGERMRLALCCLSIGHEAPDLIVLDEPTNNLDIVNMEILTAALNDYAGTLLVVSHDAAFREAVGAERELRL
ncbi:MAG: ABC-F family ATP-binding cassette domain-containing protein [Chitinophagaceae bacterium]|nr:MAG: ABC-F family ATP-binding cassette domain-containing protein [Chitinophagaceae bacterium]